MRRKQEEEQEVVVDRRKEIIVTDVLNSTFLTAVMPNAKFTVSGIHNHNLNH